MCINIKVVKGDIILKARTFSDQETLLTLYYTCTFVYPYWNYCIHVWCKAYNAHTHDLIVLDNKAVRIVHGMWPRTNADTLYFDHNTLSLKHRYCCNIDMYLYKFSKKYASWIVLFLFLFFHENCYCTWIKDKYGMSNPHLYKIRWN